MLVIISDLHMSDGTAGDVLNPGAFEMFVERLHDLAFRASWRDDDHYRPIDRIDLVLLGDVLDIIRSQRWLATDARPWSDPSSAPVVDTVSNIVDEILHRNRDGLAALRTISESASIRLPPSTQSGQPVFNAEDVPVAVRTYYMVGNHDWFLHLRGGRYDIIRQKVAHQLGLANAHTEPFPHDPYESDELLGVLRRHRVLARHGDIFDPINYSETRDTASLGDAIVIELVNRFVAETLHQHGEDLPKAVAVGLMELTHIRPLLLIPVWIEGLLDRSGVHPDLRRNLKRVWDKMADEFLQLSIVRDYDTFSPFQIVDGLEQSLKFSKRMSIGWTSRVVTWLHEMRGASSESYYQHALAEQDFRNRRARHIVYGHTHAAECVPLDASHADGYVLNQTYFNTGTWRRVYRQTQWAPGEKEFIPTETMSYAAFYQGDERSGRPFETWSGTLAAIAGDTPVHRLDGGRPTHATEQSIPAPKISVRAPHFGRSVSPSRSATTHRQ
jgi:UDP-2,3-diacylglucosamine pyrophosphatase LpxH